jgi:hypothetical protein
MVQEGDDEKDVIFHLLITAWGPIVILELLHFPDDLQPLCVESQTHRGKCHVGWNLPAAPPNLLHGVENLLDPYRYNTKASITQGLTWVLGGNAINFGSLLSGLAVAGAIGGGPVVAVPLWVAGNIFVGVPVALRASEFVHDNIREERP